MAGQGQGGNVFQQSAQGMRSAGQAAQNATTYQPMNVGNNTVAGANLNQYMNPFQQQVIDASMSGLDRQRQMAQTGIGAQAQAAGAFGGSRHGVAQAETNRGFADVAGQTLAGLNMQNFTNAQQMGQFDAGQRQAAQMANQQAGLAGANLRMGAAGTLGNLANLGFGQGMQVQNQQANMGAQQQQLMQALINAQRGQFAGFAGAPQQSVGGQVGAIGGMNYGNTQTQTMKPGLFDFLTLASQW